jgi:hypothetical protein
MKRLALIGCLLLTGCEKIMPFLWTAKGHEAPTGNKAIFLLMGQSNMTGDKNNYPDPPSPTDARLTMYKSGKWEEAQNPVGQRDYAGYSPSMAFGLEMLHLSPSTPIGLINCAEGATFMSQWQAGQPLLVDCLAQVEATKRDGRLAGILFMQGEADWGYGMTDWNYKFNTLANHLHSLYPNAKIVYGQISSVHTAVHIKEGMTNEEWTAQFQGIQATAQNSIAKMITTLDIPNDGLHFTKDGYDELGKRFARAFFFND